MILSKANLAIIISFLFFFQLETFCLGQSPISAEELIGDLGCSGCHSGLVIESNTREKAPDLTYAGQRFDTVHLFYFLQSPTKVREFIGFSRMPNFHLTEKEALSLVLFLQAQKTEIDFEWNLSAYPSEMLRNYQAARTAYPEVNESLGEKIFRSLNCVACHEHKSIEPWRDKIAPDLSIEGSRVNIEWLRHFLEEPKPIRPFGFYPGSGSRMPSFRLTEEEVEVITDYLSKQNGDVEMFSQHMQSKSLSLYSMNKAKTLLEEKLPCLGCHRLGDKGGRIGPNLSDVKTRLQPSFVYQIINDPQNVLPGIIMPKIAMPEETRELVVNFLFQQETTTSETVYLSHTENPLHFVGHDEPEKGYHNYTKYCVPCHGSKGDGNGYNAKYLSTPPIVHSDGIYMSGRPDDTLFDGIFGGGYILNKSNFMPSFGFTLAQSEIRQLVRHIRKLCACEGPLWSRDNQ